MLVRKFAPDYLLIHPMGMDYKGETYGSDSPEYRNQAIYQDMYMSALIAEWLQLGYTVLVTGDHGINADRLHGGTTPEVREVPLYMIRPGVPGSGDTGELLSQLQIAPTILKLLDLEIPETMQHPSLI
jgi:bisphosphoglycerate-independent phosphoglycerate mutase (AlkP superfamily)